MTDNVFARIVLFPLALLYGLGVSLRNFFYRNGLLKSVSFSIPVIGVGNLSMGGSGKTPHIEYMMRLLMPYLSVSVMSRGYKRELKGFAEVKVRNTAKQVGDEPLQFKRKFREANVVVSESRALGIPRLLQLQPQTQVVLLDDAFQHRAVRPGLNLLLTDFHSPFYDDYILPSGRLREWRNGYKRADAIIVTKCPEKLSPVQADEIRKKILPEDRPLYFSYYQYGDPYFLLNGKNRARLDQNMDVVLFTAIADTTYLRTHLDERVGNVYGLEYQDHHFFSKYDIAQMHKLYTNLESDRKIIITTEKDAVRLDEHIPYLVKEKLPIFVLPVEVRFHFNQKDEFDQYVKSFLLDFQV